MKFTLMLTLIVGSYSCKQREGNQSKQSSTTIDVKNIDFTGADSENKTKNIVFGKESFVYQAGQTEFKLSKVANIGERIFLSYSMANKWIFGKDYGYSAKNNSIIFLTDSPAIYANGGGRGANLEDNSVLWVFYWEKGEKEEMVKELGQLSDDGLITLNSLKKNYENGDKATFAKRTGIRFGLTDCQNLLIFGFFDSESGKFESSSYIYPDDVRKFALRLIEWKVPQLPINDFKDRAALDKQKECVDRTI